MRKSSRSRADSAVVMPSGPAEPGGPSSSLDTREVARRAFEHYCARGGEDVTTWTIG